MSPFAGVVLDADGHIDMDQFTDASDLDDEMASALEGALHSDPVDTPSSEEFAGIVQGVTGTDPDDGPFEVDGAATPDDADEQGAVAAAADEATDDDAPDDDGPDDVDGVDDPDVDDGVTDGYDDDFDDGLDDLGAAQLVVDHDEPLFPDDGADDVPVEITDIDDLL